MPRRRAGEVVEDVPQPPIGQPRGILNVKPSERKFQLSRYMPAADLSFFVEHYWFVRWDLRGQEPYVQETLPYPSVHLVIEQDASRVYGVRTGKFTRLIEGQGRVLGVKFKPGAIYPFLKAPICHLTNTSISFQDAFGVESKALEDVLRSREDDGAMLAVAESFLRERLPEQDVYVRVVNEIIDWIIAHRAITKVDDVVGQLKLNKRAVQRLFRQYVGVSPKWVIQRYRLHDIAERLAGGDVVDWAALVVELGYTDQAHLIKDFRAIVGRTPADYAKSLVEG